MPRLDWSPGSELIIGSRGSPLALWQARHVAFLLKGSGHRVTIRTVETKGDTIQDVPLAKIGDKGLFTKELDHAILDGRIHLAVHSLKDLPTSLPDGLVIAAVTERSNPQDAFVAAPAFEGRLADLPGGAVLTTSSLRREAQLRAWRPDLEILPIRGNVDTRLAKLDASDWTGTILASAGLQRLGLAHRIRECISPEVMLPAVGQGALGVVCAEHTGGIAGVLAESLNHTRSETETRAERAFLRAVEGGCLVPVGALCTAEGSDLVIEGCIASIDGANVVRGSARGGFDNPESIGHSLAGDLLGQGGRKILDELRKDRSGTA